MRGRNDQAADVTRGFETAGSQRLRFACLLALLGLVLAVAPGQAELKFFQATSTALILSDNPFDAGQPLVLSGRVQDAGRAPVAAGLVQIQVAEAPDGPWEVLEEGQPDRWGNFQVMDYTLGLESRPFYLRAWFRGHDEGRRCYGPSRSPAVPLIIKSRAVGDEALSMGFVEAKGHGMPGPGGGSWEFVIRVKALKDVRQAVFQGYAGDWVPVAGAVMDFQADTGQVLVRNPEHETDDTLVTWSLGRLLANQEATLKVAVDGVLAEVPAKVDATLPLGGIEVMSFSAIDRSSAEVLPEPCL